MTDPDDQLGTPRETFPALRSAQAEWLGAIDSLSKPDRRTQELVRLACSVILRHPNGVERHAQLAAEFGASWADVAGTLVLTQPSFGLVPANEAVEHARVGFERGRGAAEGASRGDGGDGGDGGAAAGPPDGGTGLDEDELVGD